MIRCKHRVLGLVTAFITALMFCFTALTVSAADDQTVELKLSGTDAQLVMTFPQAAAEQISSMRISLKIAASASAKITFVPNSNLSSKIVEHRYYSDTGMLNIYLADSGALFSGTTPLTVGNVRLSGTNATATVSVVEDSLEFVRGGEIVQPYDVKFPKSVSLTTVVPSSEGTIPVYITKPTTGTITVRNTSQGNVYVEDGDMVEPEDILSLSYSSSYYSVSRWTVSGATLVSGYRYRVNPTAKSVSIRAVIVRDTTSSGSSYNDRDYGYSSSYGDELSDKIYDASRGSTVTAPRYTTTVSPDTLKDASDKNITIVIPVDNTYEWYFKPNEMQSVYSTLNVSVTKKNADITEVNKIEGMSATDTVAFETKADGLGASATLTITTSSRSTDSYPQFANLYKNNINGRLEFVTVVPVGTGGKVVLPMSAAGSYTVVIAGETKMPGDIDNDCEFTIKDITLALSKFVNATSPITRDQDFKLDHNNTGKVDIKDIMALLRDLVKAG